MRPVGLIYELSDDLIVSDDSEVSNNTVAYVKVKELDPIPDDMFSNETGLRIKFDMKSSTGGLVYGRIYRSGIFVGTTQMSSSTSYATYPQDISGWSAGDLIQLYTHPLDVSRTVYVENFRVYGDFAFKSVYSW